MSPNSTECCPKCGTQMKPGQALELISRLELAEAKCTKAVRACANALCGRSLFTATR